MKDLKIGIIGGNGRMGAYFKPIFKPYAKELLISDVNTPLSNKELVEKAQVILIAVPINSFKEIVESLLPHFHKEQLLIDFTSLKQIPCSVMLKSKASVIGTHPLFGPSVKSMQGQTVALCPVRPGNWLEWLSAIFKKEGATVVETTPDTHDKMMAVVQSLVHFTSLIFADCVRKVGNPKEAFHFATPVFRMQTYIAGRILSQSSALYADIQMENPFFPEQLKSFGESFETLKDIVLEKDKNAFWQFFQACETNFSDIKKESCQITDAFIKQMPK